MRLAGEITRAIFHDFRIPRRLAGAPPRFCEPCGDLTGSFPNPTIKPSGVDTAKLADVSVTLGKLISNAVDSSKVVDNSLGTGDIADGSLVGQDIFDGTIVAADILDGSLTGAEILGVFATAHDPQKDVAVVLDVFKRSVLR